MFDSFPTLLLAFVIFDNDMTNQRAILSLGVRYNPWSGLTFLMLNASVNSICFANTISMQQISAWWSAEAQFMSTSNVLQARWNIPIRPKLGQWGIQMRWESSCSSTTYDLWLETHIIGTEGNNTLTLIGREGIMKDEIARPMFKWQMIRTMPSRLLTHRRKGTLGWRGNRLVRYSKHLHEAKFQEEWVWICRA